MEIENIKINNYGNLKDKEIDFKSDINIVYGENESGKSTLQNYIKNMLYGISKNKNGRDISDYDRYKPWGKEDYSGRLKYKLDDGQTFEIYRDFNKKNPQIYNENMEEISKEFNTLKKSGTQFFVEQTNVDETMFTSTVLSMQSEVKLDKTDQNILVQKLANLAGTGDDSVSYKKVIDKLNKKQIEEIGTGRSQNRPLNMIEDKIKRLEETIQKLTESRKDSELAQAKKGVYETQIGNLEKELNALKELKIILLCRQTNEEKINVKRNFKKEKQEKIEELKQEKEEIKQKNKTENASKSRKINIKKYMLILILILVLNVIIYFANKTALNNNVLNILNFCIAPIYIVIVAILEMKQNKKIKRDTERVAKKLDEEINLLDRQIEILNQELKKQNDEINEEQNKSDDEIEQEIQRIKLLYGSIDIDKILDMANCNNIETITYEVQEKLNKAKVELRTLEYEESNITEKLENLSTLTEEYDKSLEDKEKLLKRNNEINIAKELLNNAYVKMKNSITPKFTENMSENIAKISDGKYTRVGINDEKGLIVENEYGEYIPAERLSVGTIDQLYLSLRLSMVDDLSTEKMPIILDEAFAYYDDERLANILKFLGENMNNHQVIIFTCTNREQGILEKIGKEYNLIKI